MLCVIQHNFLLCNVGLCNSELGHEAGQMHVVLLQLQLDVFQIVHEITTMTMIMTHHTLHIDVVISIVLAFLLLSFIPMIAIFIMDILDSIFMGVHLTILLLQVVSASEAAEA